MKQNHFTWEDVSVGQFEQILSITKMKKNEIDKCIDILSVMTGETSVHYKQMKLDDLTKEFVRISGLTPQSLKPRMEDGGNYLIDGVSYQLTPSAKHMTAGQFIDYQVTIQNTPDDIAMLCAIFLIPRGKKYGEGYDVLQLKETIYNHFPYVDAMGISFFFRKTSEVLSTVILQSSIKKLKKQLKKEENPEKKTTIQETITITQKAIRAMQQKSGTASYGRS